MAGRCRRSCPCGRNGSPSSITRPLRCVKGFEAGFGGYRCAGGLTQGARGLFTTEDTVSTTTVIPAPASAATVIPAPASAATVIPAPASAATVIPAPASAATVIPAPASAATVIPAKAGIQWPGRGWPAFTLDSCRHPRRCGAGAACFCTGFLPPRPPPPSFLRKQESSGRGGDGLLLHWIPAVTLADAGPGRPAFALDSCPRVRHHRHSCESRNPVAGAGMAGFCTGFLPSPSPMRGRGGLLLHWIPAFASAATVIPAKAGIQWPGRGWPAFTLDSCRHPRRCGAGAACFCTGFLLSRPPPPSFLRKQESSGRGGDGLLLHWIPAVTLADAGPGRPASALDPCFRRNDGYRRGRPVSALDSCRHPRRCGAGAACFCTGFLLSRPPPPSFLRKQESSGRGGDGLLLHWIPAVTLADAGPGRPAFALDSCFRVRRHRHSCESRNPVAGAGMACFYTGFLPSPSPMRGRGGLLLHWIPAPASAATVIPAKAGIQWPGRGRPVSALDSCRHPRRCGAGAACFYTGFLPPRPPPPSFLRKQESSGRGGGGLLLHWIPAVTLADAVPGRPAFALDSCFRVRRHRHSCESRNPVAGAGMACFYTGFLPSPSPMRGRGGLLLHWIPAFASAATVIPAKAGIQWPGRGWPAAVRPTRRTGPTSWGCIVRSAVSSRSASMPSVSSLCG